MGNKKLLKTQFDSLPISKYLVSDISLVGHQICCKISFRTSRKIIKCPNPVLGVLPLSGGILIQSGAKRIGEMAAILEFVLFNYRVLTDKYMAN